MRTLIMRYFVLLLCVLLPGLVSAQTQVLPSGWSLVGNDAGTAVDAGRIFGNATTPTTLSSSVISVWTWNNGLNRWNFLSPSLTPQELTTYAASKGYGVLSGIAKGEGFWVNAKTQFVYNPSVSTYTLSSVASVDEGGSATYTLSSSSATDTSTQAYTIGGSNITAGDIVGGLTGTVILVGGVGTITVAAVADKITEGPESYTLTAGGKTTTTTINDTSLTSLAGNAVIDLGSYGKLIAPVQVEGKWYYFWDRSGDGTSADIGSLNGGLDRTTHDVLDGIFRYSSTGALNPGPNTDDTYRFAILNGVQLALPTMNGGMAYPQGINAYQNGTAVASGSASNPVYDEYLAIWDAYNGSGTDNTINGTPPGWKAGGYWSATPSVSGHAGINLTYGSVYDGIANYTSFVALQVL